MLSTSEPAKFPIPFGNSAGIGYIRPIPVASQIGTDPGAASLTDGFVPLNFLDKGAGGIPPDGRDMNGILYQATADLRWVQAGGFPKFDPSFSTAIGGYPNGAILQSADNTGFWRSIADNNILNPDSGGAFWVPHDFYGLSSIAMSFTDVTLTSAQYAKPILVLSGVLLGNLNLIFPNIVGQWIVANNTTGTYTVTAKTASGTGVVVDQGFNMLVFGDGTNIYNGTNNALTETLASTLFAQINGSAAHVFNVANASTSSESVPLGQADGRYAALAGNSGNNFDVAAAVAGTNAINLTQGDGRYASLAAFTGANHSLTVNGYQIFPGGLIMQWGVTATIPSGSGGGVTTFPIPFPNYTFTVVPAYENFGAPSSAVPFNVAAVSTTSFTITQQSGGGVQFFWHAFGY